MLDCPSMMGLPTRRGTEPAFFTLYIHQRSCPARRIPNLSEQNGTKMIQVYSLKKAILCRPDIRTTLAVGGQHVGAVRDLFEGPFDRAERRRVGEILDITRCHNGTVN